MYPYITENTITNLTPKGTQCGYFEHLILFHLFTLIYYAESHQTKKKKKIVEVGMLGKLYKARRV